MVPGAVVPGRHTQPPGLLDAGRPQGWTLCVCFFQSVCWCALELRQIRLRSKLRHPQVALHLIKELRSHARAAAVQGAAGQRVQSRSSGMVPIWLACCLFCPPFSPRCVLFAGGAVSHHHCARHVLCAVRCAHAYTGGVSDSA